MNDAIKNFDPYEFKQSLDTDSRGKPQSSIKNIYSIFEHDPVICKRVAFNQLTNQAETVAMSRTVRNTWTDSDDALVAYYLESVYDIYSPLKQEQAFKLILSDLKYHPIQEIIKGLKWDGKPRMSGMLTKYLTADKSKYVQEVSRLIFSGGIKRIFEPGCKFDFVPVLIGKNQGEGKSTFVRWLAMQDKFFREIGEIDGQRGVEALEGGWICELGELLALKRCKEIEAVKAYITRQVDSYRKPFERRVTSSPRQCIFIGTTNSPAFLVDKTGNRRYLPVECHSDGRKLYQLEEFCRADIEQCWAEAYALYMDEGLELTTSADMDEEVKTHQEASMIDDYRVGLISEYLTRVNRVCVLELHTRALLQPIKPTRQESLEISQIMDRFTEWEKNPVSVRHIGYGVQRVWDKAVSNK